ncbi:extracellular solute-binding protein [Paenibacillus sp. PR3]|uniref:Extracellular solute-binding protein n=1 Tax=Paenibacillus terricola TaxID=2763503 RepID=A0ABR8N0G1_9BACL|nr:extracellular solute-binding protein [Paenibacillus terricola]MBD3919939.1 extracellular solute-binding protein [Paenibacillus terricola]
MSSSVFGILVFIQILLTGCSFSSTSGNEAKVNETKETLTVQLVAANGSMYGIEHHRLAQRIQGFRQLFPNTDITIRWVQDYNIMDASHQSKRTSWIRSDTPTDLFANSKDVPDIVELVPNQMKELYRLGRIEALNLNRTAVRDGVIASNDGYVLGVKSKINPMIIYYNKWVFQGLGLETPSEEWDLNKLNDTIVRLKAAGETVYIPLNPYTLEWAASLKGGRIAAADGITYSGYLDSDETVHGVEWLDSVGTKYREKIVANIIPPAMPFDFLDGEIALAVDYAVVSDPNNYEEISQRDERFGIAGLPVGMTGINPAQVSGLSIPSQSKHKEMAMKLLNFLLQDTDALYSDIADYTLQANMKPFLVPVSQERKALILSAMKRSVPAALYMHEEAFPMTYFAQWQSPKPLADIHNGQPIREALHRYAMELEEDWKSVGGETK